MKNLDEKYQWCLDAAKENKNNISCDYYLIGLTLGERKWADYLVDTSGNITEQITQGLPNITGSIIVGKSEVTLEYVKDMEKKYDMPR